MKQDYTFKQVISQDLIDIKNHYANKYMPTALQKMVTILHANDFEFLSNEALWLLIDNTLRDIFWLDRWLYLSKFSARLRDFPRESLKWIDDENRQKKIKNLEDENILSKNKITELNLLCLRQNKFILNFQNLDLAKNYEKIKIEHALLEEKYQALVTERATLLMDQTKLCEVIQELNKCCKILQQQMLKEREESSQQQKESNTKLMTEIKRISDSQNEAFIRIDKQEMKIAELQFWCEQKDHELAAKDQIIYLLRQEIRNKNSVPEVKESNNFI